ncbi:chemotaxis protein CheW [Actinoplanes sp. TRM 88003]|uniref:Chemotaxis protein CheW n=1 Tax=Paractinoplanes aksuensis TaxID=2939490 RepID=A0ABT1DIK1_9ACTN|nr:chemotaxis protein CheW [Actinoplanes aksuensis]MCO8269890.1 chemotaxis protein CheW [Actinoplanes aksuensis]
MTAPSGSVSRRLRRLRDDFDHSFAEPARSHDEQHLELLTIRAGGRPYAIRLSQSSGVHPDRPVTPLPGPLPALLGLAGFAGAVVPVYDLAALLGHPVAEVPRWLVLAAGAPQLGLAFHELDGHVRATTDDLIRETGEDGSDGGHGRGGTLRGLVDLPGGSRPIIDIPATRALVHALTGHAQTTDEGDAP